VFRRARYRIRPFHGDQPLRIGREDFSPDFCAVPSIEGGGPPEVLIEVKYRPSVEQFVSVENQRGEKSMFVMARRQWPRLYFVLVTDRPEPRRSCFQAIALHQWTPGEPFRTVDLALIRELRIFRQNVEDHEELVRRMFDLLAGA
jgi:hypothetical protein